MSNQAPQPAKAVRPAQRPSARADLNRIESAASPWWAQLPQVAMICFQIAAAPFRVAAAVTSFAVEAAFLSVFAAIALVYFHYIPDAQVSAFIGGLGNRALAIVQNSGLI